MNFVKEMRDSLRVLYSLLVDFFVAPNPKFKIRFSPQRSESAQSVQILNRLRGSGRDVMLSFFLKFILVLLDDHVLIVECRKDASTQ